jgi:hypothetical protein
LFSVALVLALLNVGIARAHSTSFAVFSKYEATIADQNIAFVFALDKAAALKLMQQLTGAEIPVEKLDKYGDVFGKYLFQKFWVANNGVGCSHPAKLSHFGWDRDTKRVVAVTKFTCSSAFRDLTIHSLVTHDMPIPHELVGDLLYGKKLVRSFFNGYSTKTTLHLDSLPKRERRPGRRRRDFTSVPEPGRERRYETLAAAELGVDMASERASNSNPVGTVAHFVGQGVLHIFTGYDHVLFIVTLLFGVATWRRLLLIVTSFTLAHSLTLAVATLGWLTFPSAVVEPLIAATVMFVAVETLLRPNSPANPIVTFAFGLIHGFGLSSVLRDLGLSGSELAPALLGFNLGVEFGQFAIVAPLFPLVLWLRKNPPVYVRARNLLGASVGVLAACWLVLRVHEALVG